jgi:SAM-dependent methyltransferase
MEENMAAPFSEILKYTIKPPVFEPGEVRFWDDPHISKGMLEAHLDPDHDAASRKSETIDEIVKHLVSADILKPGARLLDLGCGPGLYASRLSNKGAQVTGVDISPRSIDYARKQARDNGLVIDYRCLDFLDISFENEFDIAMQIYGELNTFSDEKRDAFLAKIHKALRPHGLFLFDITTRKTRMKYGLKNRWYASEGGFWRPGKHLVLEEGFDYPEKDVWLDQYIVAEEGGAISVYRCWFHDYTLSTITPVLEKAGFRVIQVWNDLTGTPYREGGEWIGIFAEKS